MKDKLFTSGALTAVSLVGVLVMVCGISLSMGFRKLSVFSFFSVLVVLGMLRFISKKLKSDSVSEK